MSDGKLF